MIGTEMSAYTDYLTSRANHELAVRDRIPPSLRRFQSLYVSIFGIPEIGVQERIDRVLSLIPPHSTSLVDLGAGAGMLLAAAARKWPGMRMAGVELDQESYRLATKTVPAAEMRNADITKLPLATFSTKFDVATCVDVLEHVPDEKLDGFLQAACQLLIPNGTLIVHVPQRNQRRHFKAFSTWEHHDHEREGFDAAELRRILMKGGFCDIRVYETFGYLASLAWEANMLAAGGLVQALIFPLALAVCRFDRYLRSKHYNGVIVIAKKAAP